MSDEASVKSAAASLKAKLGDQKLYALVNNAGVGSSKGKDAIIATNCYGPYWMTENFVGMIDADVGRLVHVGSGIGSSFAKKASK